VQNVFIEDLLRTYEVQGSRRIEGEDPFAITSLDGGYCSFQQVGKIQTSGCEG
jgi:hypothetical protein